MREMTKFYCGIHNNPQNVTIRAPPSPPPSQCCSIMCPTHSGSDFVTLNIDMGGGGGGRVDGGRLLIFSVLRRQILFFYQQFWRPVSPWVIWVQQAQPGSFVYSRF